jgi:organic radical activating enzyme
MTPNQQPIEKKAEGEGLTLDVHSIWYTIQGEGPYSGYPAVFIRLAGCNMQCPVCDTDYTGGRKTMRIQEIVEEVNKLHPGHYNEKWPGRPIVVITGGEPFRQVCGPLTMMLALNAYHVQFETNGTLYDPSLQGLFHGPTTIICSPKAGKVHPELEKVIHSYKYVLQGAAVDPDDGLPTDVLHSGVRPARPPEGWRGRIYLQPCEEPNDPLGTKENTIATVVSCLKYGYILCLQTHKIVGLP